MYLVTFALKVVYEGVSVERSRIVCRHVGPTKYVSLKIGLAFSWRLCIALAVERRRR